MNMAAEVARWMPRVTLVTSVAGVQQILTPNPERLSVIFSVGSVPGMMVFISSQVSSEVGWLVGATGQPLEFDYWRHISIVTGPWYLFSMGGAVLTVVEQVRAGSAG